jgi:hypothetical protein
LKFKVDKRDKNFRGGISMMVETNTKDRKTEDRVEPKSAKQPDVSKSYDGVQHTAEQTDTRPLGEKVGHYEKAHAAHIEAERQVARAYRDNEVQGALALRRAEQQAQSACDSDVAAALKVREEVIAQATKAYDKAVQEAKEALTNAKQDAVRICQENISRALDTRNTVVDEAWKICDNTAEQSWAIYSRIL